MNSELGGDRHGHLGLVLTEEEYRGVSNEPYVRPDHPGELEIPERASQHESTRLRNEHKEKIKLFKLWRSWITDYVIIMTRQNVTTRACIEKLFIEWDKILLFALCVDIWSRDD